MTGLSGVGVLPTMVALAPDVKVIMVCESGNVELAKRTLAFGAFDYVTKPVDPAVLGQSIDSAVAMRRVDLSEEARPGLAPPGGGVDVELDLLAVAIPPPERPGRLPQPPGAP